MANQYLLKTDVSFRIKYQILTDSGGILENIRANPIKDFYDGILGWLVAMPTNFHFQLTTNQQMVTIKHGWSLFSAPYQILINNQLVATVTRGPALKRSPITVTSHGLPSHVTHDNINGSYWSLTDPNTGIKLLQCKLVPGQQQHYQVDIWEKLNQSLMLGILIAILNSTSK